MDFDIHIYHLRPGKRDGQRTTRPRIILGRRREAGVFAIMTAPLLLVLLGFSALAIELGMVYNRIADIHGLTKTVALAAAAELDGTPAGIAAAQAIAKSTAEKLRYKHFGAGTAYTWKEEALTFSSGPARSGTWLDGGSATNQASKMFYAKVDTADLDAAISTIETFFARILSKTQSSIRVRESAVAGRTSINVTPLAVCAMGAMAGTRSHTTSPSGTVLELVQYGFRRGVSYDLMQLNPNGQLPIRYSVNPVVAPDGSSSPLDASTLAQFVCTGTMWVPRITGGNVRVTPLPSTSPLSNLVTPLNSRFDKYTGGPCDPSGAPPDFNIKSYAYDQASGVKWMNPATGSPAATPVPKPGRLETVADLATPVGPATAYGPLWAYAKAVKAPSPPDSPEPANGYAEFALSDWSMLYKIGPTASGYPSATATPYLATTNPNYQAPSSANLEVSTLRRRVLNIPLLSCSPSAPTGSNAQASVQAIAKFFMTVPATTNTLIAEFAGILPEKSLNRRVELFP